MCSILGVWESDKALGSKLSSSQWEEGNLTRPWIPQEVKTNWLLRRSTTIPDTDGTSVLRVKVYRAPFFALARGASILLESTDRDPLRLRSGAEATVIKNPGGWNGGPGSAPASLVWAGLPIPSHA